MSSLLFRLFALAFAGLSASCQLSGEVTKLPSCWNLNTLKTGRVEGVGIFIESMHGLSLQSPGCSDRLGLNKFELGKSPEGSIRKFLSISSRKGNYIRFSFAGKIETKDQDRVIYIEQISNLAEVDEPEWVRSMVLR